MNMLKKKELSMYMQMKFLNDLSPTIKDKIERFIHQHETIMLQLVWTPSIVHLHLE